MVQWLLLDSFDPLHQRLDGLGNVLHELEGQHRLNAHYITRK